MKNLFTRKKIWIPALILVVIVTSAYYAYSTLWEPASVEVEEASVQTAVSRQGDLTIYASAAGVIVPAAEISIGFDESGTLSELLVSVGDQVESGQVLARLQTNNTEDSIAVSIANAELSLLKAEQDLDEIYDSWQMDAAQALLAVEEAEQSLDDLQDPQLQQAQAQLAILTAQENLDEATSARQRMNYPRCDEDSIDSYQTAYDKALENYNRKPDDNSLKALNSAEVNLNYCLSDWTEEEIAEADANLQVAEAELSQAEVDYERIMDGPSPGELALAEAMLAEAQREYERIKDSPDPQEIALAEAQLASAQSQLELARQEQVTVELTSPMNGTILSVDADVGERLGSSPFFTLADLEQPLLEVYLDETDLDKVAVGFEVEVIFDAIPDTPFSGQIVEVDPSLQRVSNVSTVLALAQLDADSYAKPQALPVGLNASVDVIGGRAENAVLVPVEALREIGPDEYAVFVMEDGEPRLRVVTVGLVDFTTAEITSGLEAGEVVTTGLVETE
jgi:multidrug efflux pump subunit AcrA (membrane-fusion protein)